MSFFILKDSKLTPNLSINLLQSGVSSVSLLHLFTIHTSVTENYGILITKNVTSWSCSQDYEKRIIINEHNPT